MEDQDKKITDAGWMAMQAILDREMPQEKRRKRGGWWWFGGMLGLLLLLLAGREYNKLRSPDVVPVPTAPAKSVEPVASIPAPLPAQTVSGTRSAVSNPLAPAQASTYTPPKSVANAALTPAPDVVADHAAIPPAEHQPLHTSGASRLPIAISEPTAPLYVQNIVDQNIKIDENISSDLPDEILTDAAARAENPDTALDTTASQPANHLAEADARPNAVIEKHQPLDALPATEMAALTLLERAPLPETPTVKVAKKIGSSPWRLGVAAQVFSRQVTRIDGFSTGVVLDWRPVRRFGVRTGLLYAQESWQNSITSSQQQYIPFQATTYYEQALQGRYSPVVVTGATPQTNGIVADSLAGKIVFVQLSAVRRLELPLNLFWQVTPRLRLYGGPSFAYTLYASGRTENALVPAILKQNKSAFAYQAPNQAVVNNLVQSTMPRFSTRLQANLGWRVCRYAEITAGFQMSLPSGGGNSRRYLAKPESLASDNSLYDAFNNLGSSRNLNTLTNNNFPPGFTAGVIFFLK